MFINISRAWYAKQHNSQKIQTILDAISWAQNGILPISLVAKIQIILEFKMEFSPLAYRARPK
jgi:hypothetical protein